VLCATLLPLACWWRYQGQGEVEAHTGELPSPYALARLAHRGRHVADSALAALAYQGHLVFPAPDMVVRTAQPAPANAYERSIWSWLAPGGSSVAEARQLGLSATNSSLMALDRELEAAGLLLPASERRRLNKPPLGAAALLGLFGVIKLVVGLSRDRPVGFLSISLVLLAFVTGIIMHYGAWATGRGTAVLHEIAQRLARQRGRADGAEVVIMAVAVLGVSSLHSLGLSQLAESLTPPSSNGGSGGDGGGSGCGGGGCGGCGS
jgi:uncharacterized protein (TIGR04222 family)